MSFGFRMIDDPSCLSCRDFFSANTFTYLTDYSGHSRILRAAKSDAINAGVARSMNAIPTDRVRFWANQLAGESRDPDWLRHSYVVPDVLNDIAANLVDTMRGLIGLVGQQGVGKSSALMALHIGIPFALNPNRVLFKWRPEKELFTTLLDNSHEASEQFMPIYLSALGIELESRLPKMNADDEMRCHEFTSRVHGSRSDGNIRPNPSDVFWAEGIIGKATTRRIRHAAWLKVVSGNGVILIDTPDYSKTDKRRMDRDLEDIYWFWNNLMSSGCGSTIVVAIQKEMFRDHYFLDKMRKFELKPLKPEQMVEAYERRFETTYPFSESALFALARMSRGIFRRYLRYILLTLDFWQKPNRRGEINEETVKKAIPLERVAEDTELEFVALFPKHSELRILAIRVLMHLQENGSRKQSDIARDLNVEPFTLSRLLTKLESGRHVTRTRDGTDKVVSLPP
jgi:hypothetical protein